MLYRCNRLFFNINLTLSYAQSPMASIVPIYIIDNLPRTAETLVPSLVHSTVRHCGVALAVLPRCPLPGRVPGSGQDTWWCLPADWPHPVRTPPAGRVASPCRGHNMPRQHLHRCPSCSDGDTCPDASVCTCPDPAGHETSAAPSACSACRRR